MTTARRKIELAALATAKMDDLLIPAIDNLRSAAHGGNGAGIYSDLSRLRSAMASMSSALRDAQKIYDATSWPTNDDYDAA